MSEAFQSFIAVKVAANAYETKMQQITGDADRSLLVSFISRNGRGGNEELVDFALYLNRYHVALPNLQNISFYALKVNLATLSRILTA